MRASALFGITLTILSVLACSGIGDRVIIDELITLDDGQSRIFKLDPGRYKLDITASNDGVSVEWLGSSCPKSDQKKEYSLICEMPKDGQLIISNPTVLGLGRSSTVTIKLTKLQTL